MSSTGRTAARTERGRFSSGRSAGALERLKLAFDRLFRREEAAKTPPPRKATLAKPSIDLPPKEQPQKGPARKPKPKHAETPPKPKAKAKPSAWKPTTRRRRDPAKPESRHVTVEGVRIHAVDRAGQGPKSDSERAIILIHGAGLDHRDWTFAFIDRLRHDARVIAFDRPGFGNSERPRGPAAALPAVQARILRSAAEAMGVRKAVVVGHSWGGAVAMAWALDAPDATIGVASLAGAVAPWSFTSSLRNGARMQAAARTAMGEGGLRQAAIEAIEISFDPDPIPETYLRHIATKLAPLEGPAASTMADVSTINGSLALMTPRYADLHRPVELIYGDKDAILSAEEQGGAAVKLLPHGRLTVLPGTGHMVHHAKADICLKAIERLWSEC